MSSSRCVRVQQCGDPVVSVAVSPDGTLVAAGLQKGDIVVSNAHDGEQRNVQVHRDRVLNLSFTNVHGQLLLASAAGSTVHILSAGNNAEVAELQHDDVSFLHCVVFSHDGGMLATACEDCNIRLWSTADWSAAPRVLECPTGEEVYSITFSCDDRLLASLSDDHTVRLWLLPEGAPGLVLQQERFYVRLAFSPTDRFILAAGAKDGTLSLLDMQDGGNVVHILRGHTDEIYGLRFSPDGRLLASCSNDQTVRLWDAACGTRLRVLMGHTLWVGAVAFMPNGYEIVSGSGDRTVRIWTVCKWTDRTHCHFNQAFKELIFMLICVKEKLGKENRLPRLPMELWLKIFELLEEAGDALVKQ